MRSRVSRPARWFRPSCTVPISSTPPSGSLASGRRRPPKEDHVSSPNEPVTVGPAIADPAPLGLAAFALTTFLLSAANAGLTKGGSGEWIGYAFFYGGLAQLRAGRWEFKNEKVFGATAFSTYGGFWLGLGYYVTHVAAGKGENVANDLGWILLAFAIFNTYMLLWSTQLNVAVFVVFLTLEVTEIVLFIGQFAGNPN